MTANLIIEKLKEVVRRQSQQLNIIKHLKQEAEQKLQGAEQELQEAKQKLQEMGIELAISNELRDESLQLIKELDELSRDNASVHNVMERFCEKHKGKVFSNGEEFVAITKQNAKEILRVANLAEKRVVQQTRCGCKSKCQSNDCVTRYTDYVPMNEELFYRFFQTKEHSKNKSCYSWKSKGVKAEAKLNKFLEKFIVR